MDSDHFSRFFPNLSTPFWATSGHSWQTPPLPRVCSIDFLSLRPRSPPPPGGWVLDPPVLKKELLVWSPDQRGPEVGGRGDANIFFAFFFVWQFLKARGVFPPWFEAAEMVPRHSPRPYRTRPALLPWQLFWLLHTQVARRGTASFGPDPGHSTHSYEVSRGGGSWRAPQGGGLGSAPLFLPFCYFLAIAVLRSPSLSPFPRGQWYVPAHLLYPVSVMACGM